MEINATYIARNASENLGLIFSYFVEGRDRGVEMAGRHEAQSAF
jgi:hypothetical protein